VTQPELYTLLNTTGFPVAYHHFKVDDNNPPPEPPYVVYLRENDENISSDSKVHGKFKNYRVELYTSKKDLVAEQKLEAVLEKVDPEFETSETYIDSEKLFEVIYQIQVAEKL
jgi:hypothetical protein